MVQRITKLQASFRHFLKKIYRHKGSGELADYSDPSNSLNHQVFACQDDLHRLFDGKLLLREEIPIDEKTFRKFLKQGFFTPHKSIIKTTFSYKCLRCNNDQASLFGYYPCELCEKNHLYCRHCIMMGRISTCDPLYEWTGPPYQWKNYENAMTWKGRLTIAQAAASKKVKQAIKKNESLLLWAVTGAGKTEVLFSGIQLALNQGKRVCIASPRTDVVRELLPRLRQAFKRVPIQALYGSSRDREGNAQLILSTTHQLFRFKRAFDLLIIDEVDAFPYHQDKHLQFAADRAAKEWSSKIYLTATPRAALRQKIKAKQLNYCFIPLRYHGYPLPLPKLMADYTLTKHLKQDRLPKKFLTWLKTRKRSDRQILIFVPTIELAEKLSPVLQEKLLEERVIASRKEVTSVHAEDPAREKKVLQYRQGKIYALITTTILERGVTFPSIDVVVIQANHQVFDDAALVQIAGRAGRNKLDPSGDVLLIHDGKTEAMVQAVEAIKRMNDRRKKLIQQGD